MNRIIRILLWFGLIAANTSNLYSADTARLIFLPPGKVFPVLFLDPLECQFQGGIFLLSKKGRANSDILSIVTMGISKPILAYQTKKYSTEICLDVGSFAQFEIDRIDRKTSLGGLLNNDFRIGGAWSTKMNSNIVRLRFFHISSHLGDDYIIRNQVTRPNDRSQNFEQFEITYLADMSHAVIYLGTGFIVSENVYRKRWSTQAGGWYQGYQFNKNLGSFAGINISFLEEDHYNPSVRIASGISFIRNDEILGRLWIEYYTGFLPYSTLNFERIQWYGLSMHWVLF